MTFEEWWNENCACGYVTINGSSRDILELKELFHKAFDSGQELGWKECRAEYL